MQRRQERKGTKYQTNEQRQASVPFFRPSLMSAKMKEHPLTEMRFGWRREDSSAAPKAPRTNNLYQQARPASFTGVPDTWLNIRNVTDVKEVRRSRSTARPQTVVKPVVKKNTPA